MSQTVQTGSWPADGQGDLVGLLLRLSFVRAESDVIAAIRDNLRRLIGSDGITVVLRDDDKCHYVEEDAIGPLWKGQKFPMSQCISGWSMIHGQTVAIDDIYADARIPHAAYRPTFVKSLAMVPIRSEAPLGAIGVYWADRRHATPHQLGILQTIANAASVAFANAELHRSLTEALADAQRRRDEAENLLREKERVLAEREVLIREIHHRVKNNLQVVAALLRVQLGAGATASQLVDASIRRIMAMGRVHEHLYRETDLSSVRLGEYIRELIAKIEGAAASSGRIRCHAEFDDATVDIADATAIGLVVTEAVTNAVRHAFPGGGAGRVRVTGGRAGADYAICVSDDGIGLERRTERTQPSGAGLQIIETLARQLRGAVTFGGPPGCEMQLRFPLRSVKAGINVRPEAVVGVDFGELPLTASGASAPGGGTARPEPTDDRGALGLG